MQTAAGAAILARDAEPGTAAAVRDGHRRGDRAPALDPPDEVELPHLPGDAPRVRLQDRLDEALPLAARKLALRASFSCRVEERRGEQSFAVVRQLSSGLTLAVADAPASRHIRLMLGRRAAGLCPASLTTAAGNARTGKQSKA